MGALTTSLFAGQVLRVDLEIEPHRLARRGYALWLGSIEMTKFFFIVTDHLLHFGILPHYPLSIIVQTCSPPKGITQLAVDLPPPNRPELVSTIRKVPRMLTTGAQDKTVKLLIVENDRILLTTLASALHAKNYGIVGTATEAPAAIEYFNRIKPDVVILDIDLGPGPTGVDLAVHMRSKSPMLGVLFCTSIDDKRLVSAPARLLESSFYLPKQNITKIEMIESAIRESIRLVRSPEGASLDIYRLNEAKSKLASISDSDLQLLKLVASGLSNKEIAFDKGIALKSCENAIARLAKKLDIPFTIDTNQRVLLTRKYFEYMGKIA